MVQRKTCDARMSPNAYQLHLQQGGVAVSQILYIITDITDNFLYEMVKWKRKRNPRGKLSAILVFSIVVTSCVIA